MIPEISDWCKAGADLAEGVRLFAKYGSSPAFCVLLELDPERYRQQLFNELVRIGDVDPVLVDNQRRFFTPVRNTFRNEWPFLDDPSCLPEFKILAADKISSYRRYVSLHAQLFDCTDPNGSYRVASDLLMAYMENRDIHAEFLYYKEHRNVLGKHPVFDSLRRRRELKKKSVLELVTIRKRLKENIWRVRSEISKGNRPDLFSERKRRLEMRQVELEEVENLLKQYE